MLSLFKFEECFLFKKVHFFDYLKDVMKFLNLRMKIFENIIKTA
jgi:hypothetical protein